MKISAESFPPLRILIVLGDNAIVSFSRSAPAGNPVGQHSLVSHTIKLIWTTNGKENASQLLYLSTYKPFTYQNIPYFGHNHVSCNPREFNDTKMCRRERHMLQLTNEKPT